MKDWNLLNKIFIAFTVILASLLVYKNASYRASDKYYYIASVSCPEDFPIYILGIWFNLENEDDIYASSFYKDKEAINSFRSDWGSSEYYETDRPAFLPDSLYLEYVDYRAQQYYLDTIPLPKDTMKAIFKYAKNNNLLQKLNSWKTTIKGLEYHVGIANEGNIIFWLIGNDYEKEFYRVQLKPKPFTGYIQSTGQQITNSNAFFDKLFENLSDSIKQKLKTESNLNIQYKDSIPEYFHNLQQ